MLAMQQSSREHRSGSLSLRGKLTGPHSGPASGAANPAALLSAPASLTARLTVSEQLIYESNRWDSTFTSAVKVLHACRQEEQAGHDVGCRGGLAGHASITLSPAFTGPIRMCSLCREQQVHLPLLDELLECDDGLRPAHALPAHPWLKAGHRSACQDISSVHTLGLDTPCRNT